MILKPLATCLFATGLAVSALRGCNNISAKNIAATEPVKALGSPLSFLESSYWASVTKDGALPEQDMVVVSTKGGVKIYKLENGEYAFTANPSAVTLLNSYYGILSGDNLNPENGYIVFLDEGEVKSVQDLIFANGGVVYRATDGAFEQTEFTVPEGLELSILTCLDKDNVLTKSFALFEDSQ